MRPSPLDEEGAAKRLERFDGLLLIGGGDVDPRLYGEEAHPEVYDVDAALDRFEISLASVAVARGMPVLAICRGLQVLNVALGGTLVQHLEDRTDSHRRLIDRRHVMHPVTLEPGTRVAKAMGVDRADCPSYHHQALGRLGAGLVATGWSDDGLVEAAELEDGWVVGVQWHPERSASEDPVQQGLFDAFVDEASAGGPPSTD